MSQMGPRSQFPLKRSIFTSDVAVQTDNSAIFMGKETTPYEQTRVEANDDNETTLSASDLASILKWSQDISSDINLSSGV